jgi:hypothetical protein
MAQEVTHPTINFVPGYKDQVWLKMTCPGLNADDLERLANHLGEKLDWFTWYHETPDTQSPDALVTALRSVYATHPICVQAADALDQVDRERRTGAHLLATARSMGWKDDGEGAQEFLLRRAREVAFEDCGRSAYP